MNSISPPLRAPARTDLVGFRSLERETRIDDVPVRGTLPTWLAGTLYRNGPAKFEVGADRYVHWFDGLAMLHAFTIADGRVAYANRTLATPAAADAARSGRIRVGEFATLPKLGVVERLRAVGRGSSSHNANVNVVPCGDEMLALTETPTRVAFDPRTLETLGLREPTGDAMGQTTTAHPHHIAARRESIDLTTRYGASSSYRIDAIADGTLTHRHLGSIATSRPAYLHTFAVTDRYAIVVEFPLTVNPLDLLFLRRPFIDNFVWDAERGTRFHALELATGELRRTWQGEACFAFHHANAYDDGETIVLDVSRYRDASIVHALDLANLRGPGAVPAAELVRFRLSPGRSDVTEEMLSHAAAELPRVAPRALRRPYRYVYGVSNGETGAVADEIVKVDVERRVTTTWHETGHHPGEAVFVARPGAADEDDGVLASVVLDGTRGTSYLLVLDARELTELARVELPHHVPFGFHGQFVRS